MSDQPKTPMTPQEFAAKADADFVNKKEAERRKALGLPEPKLAYTEADHAATRQRVAAAEEKRKADQQLPDVRGMDDQQFAEACRKAGVNTYKPMGS